MKFYLASASAFYDPALFPEPPAGAVEISDELHAQLFEGQAAGQEIIAGSDGLPMLRDRAGPAPAVVLRRRRDLALAACDWAALPDAPLDDAQRAAWLAYRRTLRELPQAPGWPAVALPTPPRA